MEMETEKSPVVVRSGTSHPDLRDFVRRSRSFLEKVDECGECSLEVEKRGRWFVLRGRVDSQLTKSRLIGMVPEVDGAQWIVDRLHVHVAGGKGING